jgi:hypothetical protein
MSLPWTELVLDVKYGAGQGFAIQAKAIHRGDPDTLDISPWYVNLHGDELLDVMAVLCEQAWIGRPLDGTNGREEPQLPF